MKNLSKLFAALIVLAFVSCQTSELDNTNNERTPKSPKEISCETAFGASDYCFSEDGFNRWGWVIGPLCESPDKTTHPIYAAAGRCMTDRGYLVGYLYVDYYEGVATVTFDAEPGYEFTETHLYVGNEMYPTRRGVPTVAPGQYPYSDPHGPTRTYAYTIEDLRDCIYVIGHAVVCDAPDMDEEDDDDTPT
mgnify:CR=1 FL=1